MSQKYTAMIYLLWHNHEIYQELILSWMLQFELNDFKLNSNYEDVLWSIKIWHTVELTRKI